MAMVKLFFRASAIAAAATFLALSAPSDIPYAGAGAVWACMDEARAANINNETNGLPNRCISLSPSSSVIAFMLNSFSNSAQYVRLWDDAQRHDYLLFAWADVEDSAWHL